LRARECPMGVADWATIGRRIARAAAMATAVRVTEVGMSGGRKAAGAEMPGVTENSADK
jgi:hypothetical protein